MWILKYRIKVYGAKATKLQVKIYEIAMKKSEPLSIMDRKNQQNVDEAIEDLNNIIMLT